MKKENSPKSQKNKPHSQIKADPSDTRPQTNAISHHDLTSPAEPIAIVGMAYRLPGQIVDDDTFWQALVTQQDLVTSIPATRWATEELQHPKRSEPGRSITFAAGVLDNIDTFDAAFFGISPREAAWLDPQQRLLLELSWESMENAGIPPSTLAGTNCGVFVGISGLDYGTRALDDLAAISAHSMTGNTLSIAANRLSYVYDLRGPSLAIDTACSSSLVALHQACQALRSGDAPVALVGGVNLLLHPYPFIGFTKASMLSADGRCKTFDANGNGYVRSEGGAVLILKPLSAALADGNTIQALICATGTNADGGRKTGMTIPSPQGQADLMARVLKMSGMTPDDIDFLEAHGTGTAVGDPVEAAAISAAYAKHRQTPLLVGSVKANLGHLEAASGMAGLIKAILALRHRALPGQIHLDTPNPAIDFAALNLQLPTRQYTFTKQTPLVGGVNSFGFGGANAHVLLQEFPQTSQPATTPALQNPQPLLLSARSEKALQALADSHAQALSQLHPDLFEAWTHASLHGRDTLPFRLAVEATTAADASLKLSRYAQGDKPAGLVQEVALPPDSKIAFVYAGNGAQWLGMAQRLIAESPDFAELITALDRHMQEATGFSLLAELNADLATSRLAETAIAQPLLFAIQVSLTQLLARQGIKPDAVAGHSVGEIAAAWASGALDIETAINVVVARSTAQSLTRGTGKMAVANISEAEMQAILASEGSDWDITIAGINSPQSLTLSGSRADLDLLQDLLATRRIAYKLLDLDYAFHSPHMDPARDLLAEKLGTLPTAQPCRIPFASSVTGTVLNEKALNAQYWWQNVREPVRFEQAMSSLISLGCRVFIEISPHAVLQRYIEQSLESHADTAFRTLPTLKKHADGWQHIRDVALRVVALKPEILKTLPTPAIDKRVKLPNYPWQRESYWHPKTNASLGTIDRKRVHPLLGWSISGSEPGWENVIDTNTLPWLIDHQVGGAIVLPGAAYLEMALAAAHAWQQENRQCIEDIDIVAPMLFDENNSRIVRFLLSTRDGSFQIVSRNYLSEEKWQLNCLGRITPPNNDSEKFTIAPIAEENPMLISAEQHYQTAAALGLKYGPAFKWISHLEVGRKQIITHLTIPKEISSGYFIHPAIADSAYQSLIDLKNENNASVALLPVKNGKVITHGIGRATTIQTTIRHIGSRSLLADFHITDENNQLLAEIRDSRFRAAPITNRHTDDISRWFIKKTLHPHPLEREIKPLQLSISTDHIQKSISAFSSKRKDWHEEAMPLLEALVLSFTFEACQEIHQQNPAMLSTLATTGSSYTIWLLSLMQRHDLLLQHGNVIFPAAASSLPEAADIWITLKREFPEALPQLLQLGHIGKNLDQIMLHTTSQDAIIASIKNSMAREMLFNDDPVYLGTTHAIEASLKIFIQQLPSNQQLHILEVGRPDSHTHQFLNDHLNSEQFDYTLAISTTDQFSSTDKNRNNPTIAINSSNWDSASISTDKKFDIIILTHTLHTAENYQAAIKQIHQYLAPGGHILAAERSPDWSADFLFGLDEKWWQNESSSESKLSSLKSAAQWASIISSAGFLEVSVVKDNHNDETAIGTYLILAKKALCTNTEARLAQTSSWTLVHDSQSENFTTALSHQLKKHNQEVCNSQFENNINLVADNVVLLIGWDTCIDQASKVITQALYSVKTISSATGSKSRLWFITKGGALASASGQAEDIAANPVQAALWGFGRVVMNEHPELECKLIDIRTSAENERLPERVAKELVYPDTLSEILLSDNCRHTLVIDEVKQPYSCKHSTENTWKLDFTTPGQLKNLIWKESTRKELLPEEVEVSIQAAGVNFRDVMFLMGILPDEAIENGFAGPTLGLEFAGIITRTGKKVQDFALGDRVMGFGSACFASHVITRQSALAKIPESWTYELAATVPTVFFTVYYALIELAKIKKGERILVHAGAGGIGIAAIQLCKSIGAEVYATAGSDEKRDFVNLLGADHVFDSRSLDYAEQILSVTQGEGVDVVLNSLSGEAIRRNISILKPFGRFLELGKRDFFENTNIGLRPFKNNISYYGIDADQLLTCHPALSGKLFKKVMSLFSRETFTPLPYRSYSERNITDAFRLMLQGKHTGKIVVKFNNAEGTNSHNQKNKKDDQMKIRGTWLITGGTSGFGLATALWLAENGVRNLILASSSGIQKPDTEDIIEKIKALDTKISIEKCNISNQDDVHHLFNKIKKKQPSIKGIIHAANLYDDRLIKDLDEASIFNVTGPKLIGAWNLHHASADISLDYFVLYSSITTAIGNPGQANYVAANAGLEGLATMRQQAGLPATVIAWGPIGDTGYLARHTHVRDGLARHLGKQAPSADNALKAMDHLLTSQEHQIAASFDWPTLAKFLPSSNSFRFIHLAKSNSTNIKASDMEDFHSLISEKSSSEAITIIENLVRIAVSQTLAIAEDRIKPHCTLHELGFDSLMAVDLALGLEARFDIKVPPMVLNDSPTVEKLASFIYQQYQKNSKDTLPPDAMILDLAKKHGTAISAEELKSIGKESNFHN